MESSPETTSSAIAIVKVETPDSPTPSLYEGICLDFVRPAFREWATQAELLKQPVSMRNWRSMTTSLLALPPPANEEEEEEYDRLLLFAVEGRHVLHIQRLRERKKALEKELAKAEEGHFDFDAYRHRRAPDLPVAVVTPRGRARGRPPRPTPRRQQEQDGQDEDLPNGWVCRRSARYGGERYYFNTALRLSQWSRP